MTKLVFNDVEYDLIRVEPGKLALLVTEHSFTDWGGASFGVRELKPRLETLPNAVLEATVSTIEGRRVALFIVRQDGEFTITFEYDAEDDATDMYIPFAMEITDAYYRLRKLHALLDD